jgi:hypothetical protein
VRGGHNGIVFVLAYFHSVIVLDIVLIVGNLWLPGGTLSSQTRLVILDLESIFAPPRKIIIAFWRRPDNEYTLICPYFIT